MAKRRLKIFISYARSDQEKAHDLYKRLAKDSFDAWIDKENLLPGQDWELEIRKFIREADVVIVCLSKNFNKAGFRQKEVRLALDVALEKPEGEIFIIPARLEECDNLESLRKWNWVDLFVNDGYENLMSALRQRASEIGKFAPNSPVNENRAAVQLILEGEFSEFSENRREDLIGILAALLRVDKRSIRVLRTYSGSIVMEIELTKIGANRLLNYFEKGDIRLKSLGIISVKFIVEQRTGKRISTSKKVSKDARSNNTSRIGVGNQSIVVAGDVIGSNLVIGNENKIETLGRNVSDSEIKIEVSIRSERLVPDRVLKDWLKIHGLAENPFGDFDLRNYPYYPKGAAWPNRWEAFFDPISSFALCPTPEDAQALSYLLRKECLPLDKDAEDGGTKRWLFPLMASPLLVSQLQSPLPTLAHCAAQVWLDFLPKNSDKFLELSPAKQNALLELLHWSLGSAHAIINLLQSKGLEEDTNGLSLVLKIEKYVKELSANPTPQDSILLSWLKLRPLFYKFTYLIFPLDRFPVATRSLWLEQLNISIPEVSVITDGIISKVISSTDFSSQLPLPVTPLNWSEDQLKLSINYQFEAAMDKTKQREMGQIVDFRALFGSDTAIGYFETEDRTIHKLISASHNSLARMLTLGNRLLQHHCENRTKDGAPEKYLYVEDLEAILKTV
ncbi:MAG: toll/interleukin-1 receptor domain-containing protein [Chloroflexota bacterium]